MRVVHKREEMASAIDSAKIEAKNSFGDDHLLIEKYFTSVRHVEFQILGDKYGNVIHLYERECSVQRRHQKVIEVLSENIENLITLSGNSFSNNDTTIT
jgi:acetyl/propionyl-CoA carboxylase alpha subunit